MLHKNKAINIILMFIAFLHGHFEPILYYLKITIFKWSKLLSSLNIFILDYGQVVAKITPIVCPCN